MTAAETSPALADGLADEAELHFDIGREHFKKRNYRTAIEHFLASNRLVPNRNVVFNIALAFEELGRFADAYRYYIDATAGETNEQMLVDIRVALARIRPQVAVLRIETTPPGATIYLDRTDLGSRGSTPKPLAVPEGRYRVVLELNGYEPAVVDGTEARLGQDTLVSVALTRIVGTVRASVRGVEQAAVHVDRLDGAPACQTSCSLDLPPGRHTLFFSRDGFQTTRQEVTVAAREVVEAIATLSPLTGSVLVRANEQDALVEIDGQSMGFTPTVVQGVPVGKRLVRVSLRGFGAVERQIEVRANRQAELLDARLIPDRQVEAASRFMESIDDAPASVSVIEQAELRAFGYPTVAEALRGVRGMYLSNDQDVVTIGIRGLGEPGDYNSRLLLLSDGHTLNNNVLNSAFTGSEGRVGLQDIDHIEIIRGPGSLLYGTGAFSGVINLVPRPRETPTAAYAGAGAYDDSTAYASAGFTYRLADDAGVWASLSGAHSDGHDQPVKLRDPQPGGPAVMTANGVNAFRSGGTAGRAWVGPVTAQWFLSARSKHVPAGIKSVSFNDPRTVYEDTQMMAELRFEPRVSNEIRLLTRIHANHYSFHAEFAGETLSIEDYKGTWFGGELRVVWTPVPSLRLTAGGEVQLHPEATLEGRAGAPYMDERQPYSLGAGYGVAEGAVLPWLRLSAGARLDINSKFGAIGTTRLAAIAKPWSGSVLKVMGGSAFRAPSIFEQYYSYAGGQLPAVDPARGLSLRPESIMSGEVELSHRFAEDWVALITGHMSRIASLITAVPDNLDPTEVRNVNRTSPALTAGTELELRKEWRDGWMLSANYGYQHTEYADTGKPLVNAPQHLSSVRGIVPILDERVNAGLRVTLEAPRLASVEMDERTRGAVIADVTVSGELRRFHVRYVLGVYNLTDARYDNPVRESFFSATSRQSGRTILADIRLSYP